MKKQNIYFLIAIILIMLVGIYTLVREEKGISIGENRTLQKFEHFTLKSYIKGDYQNKLESAMSDQFTGSETIKLNLKSMLQFFDYNDIPKSVCKNRYVSFSDWHANYNCDDYLLYKYENYNETIEKIIKGKIDMYNRVNENIDTYYYFIPTSKILDFENNKYSIDVIKLLEENLKNQKSFSYLDFNNYDEYKEYFYKTDHHWNYKGSQKAYEDIIYMFNKNANVVKPEEEIVFNNITFYGSLARASRILDYKESFKAYKYNLSNIKTLINREVASYGNEDEYLRDEFSEDKFANHYALYYGDDYGEVIIEGNSGKRNLLIIGDSYTNSINKLIGTHFNKTYDVDLRHYKEAFNEDFDIKTYIEKNDIDKVLIIMNYDLLLNSIFDIDWEE